MTMTQGNQVSSERKYIGSNATNGVCWAHYHYKECGAHFREVGIRHNSTSRRFAFAYRIET